MYMDPRVLESSSALGKHKMNKNMVKSDTNCAGAQNQIRPQDPCKSKKTEYDVMLSLITLNSSYDTAEN